MSDSALVVRFRGISKREEILLRSFLNLSDSHIRLTEESGDAEEGPADVVVLDESVLEQDPPPPDDGVSYIVLGVKGPYDDLPYVSRPLHWSTFRKVFDEAVGATGGESSPVEELVTADLELDDMVLDSEVSDETPPDELEELTVGIEVTVESPGDADEEESGVRPMAEAEVQVEPAEEAPDPEGHTEDSSEAPVDLSALEVVGGEPGESALPPGKEDAEAAKTADGEASGIALRLSEEEEDPPAAGKNLPDETVIMETDAIDAWTISIEAELETVSQSLNYMTRGHLAREPAPRRNPVTNLGVRLPPGIRFWDGDTEILLNGSPIFLIDETGQRLYSDSPIREWTKILRERNLTRRDLADGWYVDPSVKSSPLPWFIWCCAQARSKGRLVPNIDPGQQYLLEKWPHFELIRNDNQSLKLCALLFAQPESVKTLVAKSDIKGRKVVAFMNACYLLGLIKMAGIDEEVVWSAQEEPRSLTLMQRLRRTWGM